MNRTNADFVTSILNLKNTISKYLETINEKHVGTKVLVLLQKELEVLSVQRKIQNRSMRRYTNSESLFFT
jgi:ATP-dependent Lon protease